LRKDLPNLSEAQSNFNKAKSVLTGMFVVQNEPNKWLDSGIGIHLPDVKTSPIKYQISQVYLVFTWVGKSVGGFLQEIVQ